MNTVLTPEEFEAYREGQLGLRPQPNMEDWMAAQNAWLYGYPSNTLSYDDIMSMIYQRPPDSLANTVNSLVPMSVPNNLFIDYFAQPGLY